MPSIHQTCGKIRRHGLLSKTQLPVIPKWLGINEIFSSPNENSRNIDLGKTDSLSLSHSLCTLCVTLYQFLDVGKMDHPVFSVLAWLDRGRPSRYKLVKATHRFPWFWGCLPQLRVQHEMSDPGRIQELKQHPSCKIL